MKGSSQFWFSLFMCCMDGFCSEPRHLGHNILASFGLGCNQSCILNYLLSMTLFHFTALMLVQLLIMTSQITIVNRSSQSYLLMLPSKIWKCTECLLNSLKKTIHSPG